MQFAIIAIFALFSVEISAQSSPITTWPFYGQLYSSVPTPRGLFVDPSGDVLVLSQGSSSIFTLTEVQTGNGTIRVDKVKIVDANGRGLNHGLTFHEGFIYASSPTIVFRWPYAAGNRTLVMEQPEIVIFGMPSGGHRTRTLTFAPMSDVLYVSVGSNANVDSNSNRSRIRRFDLSNGVPAGGISFGTGQVFADGLRNEVGLAWDGAGVLWGVENGADQLNRPDIGGDIHNGNPAEDLNRFNRSVGTHYGYPYCFGSYSLPGFAAGTQFAWPTFMNDGVHTDAWCRTRANNEPPVMAMPAHNAPLGIEFYDGRGCGVIEGAPPCSLTGDAFVSFHGSWNSDIKVGYRVAWLSFNKDTLEPTGQNVDVIFDPNTATCGNRCFRPVNAVFNNNGHLIVSADSTNEIFRLWHGTPPPKVNF